MGNKYIRKSWIKYFSLYFSKIINKNLDNLILI